MRPLLTIVALSAVLALGACSPQHENAVKQLLNDPESARFSEVTRGLEAGDACGYVNAKNMMGGYAGKTPFYYRASGETAVMAPMEDSDFRIFFWNMTSSDSERRFSELNQRCAGAYFSPS